MKKHTSKLDVGGPVQFPEWRGERHYMVPFTPRVGPLGEVERFAGSVRQMLAGMAYDPDRECYLMVDEQTVEPGAFHRRPGLHVDGYWHPSFSCHGGGGGGGHGYTPPHHSQRPTHLPTPTPTPREPYVPIHPVPTWRIVPVPPAPPPAPPLPHPWKLAGEALVLASSYSSARALIGEYERDFAADWNGGDCSAIHTSDLDAVQLASHTAYHLDVFTLHESLPVRERVRRTLIRINAPGAISLQPAR